MKAPFLRPAAEGESLVGLRVRRLLAAAVAVGALVLLAMSATTLSLVSDYQDSTRWVNHTYQVKDLVSGMRANLFKSESSRRGYLITRDPYYLGVYQEAATEIPRLEEKFRAMTADNPRQQAHITDLTSLFARKLAAQEETIQTVRAERPGVADVAALIREDQGTLNHLRDMLSRMLAEEDRLLADRADRQANDASFVLGVVLASGAVLALLAGGSFLLVRRYAADLDRSQTALRRLNAGLESEVHRRTADLTLANEEIQRFAYIVSHDLRAPLVNVMGFTSELETALKPLRVLADRVKAEAPALLSPAAAEAIDLDLPESIGFIRTSTQKMDRLINAILRLSREGRRTLAPEPIAMAALFEVIAASLKQQTEAKGARIELEAAPPDLVNDRLAVEQVFSNVIENALKYLKPGRAGVIRVRGRAEGAMNVYEIEDNGRGIDPKDHERVFELFRRAGAQDQPGEGIGLAHVRALVYRLGGTITVDSELDRGATFRLCLPPVLNRVEPST